MTSVAIVLATNFFGLILVIGLLWLIALAIRDVSFIDAFWAFGMVLLAWGTAMQVGGEGLRAQLLLGLTTLWGLRLSIHLLLRWLATGEDPRYQKIIAGIMKKRHWGWEMTALVSVFLTQAPLLFITSLPAQIGIWASAAVPASSIGVLGWIGVGAALTGIAFETVGDWQLHRFRGNPDNHGKILDTGLWRYTRHPNYFGDALTWWGIFLVAADAAWWVAAASVIGPLFLSFTLTKWSGKALLERGMKHTRPGYDDYVARTSGFIPGRPKSVARDPGLDADTPVAADVSALGNAPRIRAILTEAAREGRSVSYSELLGELGFRFTRPKMRAVVKTLAEVDRLCAADGEPDMAVLVVRESDRLPGQGWWVGGTALLLGYDGPWEGAAAVRFIREQQQAVFDFWAGR